MLSGAKQTENVVKAKTVTVAQCKQNPLCRRKSTLSLSSSANEPKIHGNNAGSRNFTSEKGVFQFIIESFEMNF